MTDDQFKRLVDDIKKNGQLEPIWVYKGKIIDGRHRFKACKKLDIEPKTEEWDGKGSLVRFVVSRNLHRRHLNASQRAAVANDMTRLLEIEAKHRKVEGSRKGGKAKTKRGEGKVGADLRPPSRRNKRKTSDDAGKMVNVSPRQVELMKKVKKEAPQLVKPIKAGELSVNRASNIISLPQKERKIVLDRGKKSGDYGGAYKEHSETKKKKPKQTPITRTELLSALKGAADSAKACEGHLKAAADVSKKIKVNIDRGRGIQALTGTLKRCLNAIEKMTE
jgi:ParB-like chromosome segregation protein Spo0J